MIKFLFFSALLFLPLSLFSQQFTRIDSGPVVSDGGDSRSVNWIDTDNDGDLDLFITNGPRNGQNNLFYENQGDGTFAKIDSIAITKDAAPSDGSTWGDFNNDGYPDLFVANWYGANNLLYLNKGKNDFDVVEDVAAGQGGYSESGAWIDMNQDGFLDLTVANSAGNNKNNFVYRNTTKEHLSGIWLAPISTSGGSSRHMDWADYDNDGHPDLFIANENSETNFLYHNNGDGKFTEITVGAIATSRSSSFGSSWGDYDNDGNLDLFVANWGASNNLYKNDGDGTFTRIAAGAIVSDGGHSIGTAWGDVDNDGDLDLFVANGFSPLTTSNFLYLNNGDGTFSKDNSIVSTEKGWTYGASFGDLNRDGYLDLAVAKCFGANENNALYLNNGGANNWLAIKLAGSVSNRSAIQAVVRAKATINGKAIWQMRQVSGQDGYCGQNLEVHFGLGDASVIDSLVVRWPSGQIQTVTGVEVNQLLQLTESATTGFLRPHFKAEERDATTSDVINFKDLSVADEDQPIVSWEWDFNNDGITDSDEENPGWQFQTAGTYSITLKVSNGSTSESKTFEDYITITSAPTSVAATENNDPSQFRLAANYPNPFNPTTSIEYEIGRAGFIELNIYSLLGKQVGTLVRTTMKPGHYKAAFDARHLPSGVYLYRLSVGGKIYHSKKMLLLK